MNTKSLFCTIGFGIIALVFSVLPFSKLHADANTYLNFTAVNGPATIKLSCYRTPDTISLQYSIDSCVSWNNYSIEQVIQLNTGSKVFFKATTHNSTFSKINAYYFFVMTGSISADGNIMSLLDSGMLQDSVPEYAFRELFTNCSSLITAPYLPAINLHKSCYSAMFFNCTSLALPPALPATNLCEKCYFSMFGNCTHLTSAPALPAMNLANSCYNVMFSGCSSLINPPLLPATNLEDYCYSGMFYGCTSLNMAPILPATIMKNACYCNMFYNCSSLVTPPALPGTRMAYYCYSSMFYGCTSLTSLPVLLPTNIDTQCFIDMFRGCSSLVVNVNPPGRAWLIPGGYANNSERLNMFVGTSGTMNGTPLAHTTYYVQSDTSQSPICQVLALSNDTTIGTVYGSGQFVFGTTDTLIATAKPHCHFVRWSNSAINLPTIQVLVYKDSTITATFAKDQYTMSLNSNDTAMGSAYGDGIYNYGDTAIITAIPKAHYHFVSWSNGLTTPTIAISVEKDSSLTATFAIDQHTITVTSNDTTMGLVSGDGLFDYGSLDTLTAVANSHCHFVSWSNGIYSPTQIISVESDSNYTAFFALDQHKILTISNDTTMGKVTGGGLYNYGDNVTLTATANAHYHFVSWSNGSTKPTISFIAESDSTLTATFEPDVYSVTAMANYVNRGVVTGSGQYEYMDRATLTAAPSEGYKFTQWSNGETDQVIYVTVVSDSVITAIFDVDGTGVDNVYDEFDVTLHPNPVKSSGTVYVEVSEDVRLVEVYDADGKLVDRIESSGNVVEVSGLEVAGMYIVRVVRMNGVVVTKKVIVE